MQRSYSMVFLTLAASACSARGAGGGNFGPDDGSTDDTSADVAPSDVPITQDTPAIDLPAVDVPVVDVPVVDIPAVDKPLPDVPHGGCMRDSECTGSTFCDTSTGACMPIVCTPGRVSCVSSARARVCNDRGSAFTEMDCSGGCSGGVCTGGTTMCTAPRTSCEGLCVDTSTDMSNCGRCFNPCSPGQTCSGGVCITGTTTCSAPSLRCGTACVDVTSDATNCGTCGHACSAGLACVGGVCMVGSTTTRYMRGTSPATFVAACGMTGVTTILAGADDTAMLIPLAFNFRYWAATLSAGSMIDVTSNGFISLAGVSDASLSGTVPSASTPNAVIAAYWGDDYNRPTGQCVATVGAAPSRRQVFEWNDAEHCCTESAITHLTYEIILNEGGAIDVLYQTMMGARMQTVGIENQTGTLGLSGCADGTSFSCVPTAGMAVRYAPIP